MQTDAHTVTVAYDRPFAELVGAGGYDHVNEYVTGERFPVGSTGVRPVELLLVHLGRTATTEEVRGALEEPGIRPGRIAELLALGAEHPELQRTFPIVAPGAGAAYPDDYLRIPFLWGTPRVRQLDLRWDEHTWGGNIRFLAVRASGS